MIVYYSVICGLSVLSDLTVRSVTRSLWETSPHSRGDNGIVFFRISSRPPRPGRHSSRRSSAAGAVRPDVDACAAQGTPALCPLSFWRRSARPPIVSNEPGVDAAAVGDGVRAEVGALGAGFKRHPVAHRAPGQAPRQRVRALFGIFMEPQGFEPLFDVTVHIQKADDAFFRIPLEFPGELVQKPLRGARRFYAIG